MNSPITIQPLNVFERKNIKNFIQLFGAFIISTMNVALIGSDISHFQLRHTFDVKNELTTFLFLAFLDVTTLIPIIFQTRRIQMWEDRIVIQTLFWKSKLPWSEITEISQPRNFTLAILKTRRLFYLINKKDFPEIELFFAKVKEKLG